MGDLTADVYVDTDTVKYGGAALNMAIWTKRLRARATIVSVVGSDTVGRGFLGFIRKQTLSASGVAKKRGRTSSIEIFLTDGERRYGIWTPGVLAGYHLRKKDKALLKRQDAIVITVYPQYEHVLREFTAWKQTLHNGKRPLIVINYGDLKGFESNLSVVRRYIHLADILVFGLDKDKDESLINEIRDTTLSSQLSLFTLGKYGSIAWQNGRAFVEPAKETDAVDTTGAGDSFLAAFLVSYLTTGDIQESLEKGSLLATRVIGSVGAY